MSFANLVTPEEYGRASIGFQVVTYSAFIVMGVNQVLLKRYSLEENKQLKHFFVQYNVFYNLLVCLFSILLISILFSSKDYVIYLSLICGVKLILESAIAINRVNGNMVKINIIYLSYSVLFLVLFFSFVSNVFNFFKYWSYSIVFGACIGALLSFIQVFKSFDVTIFKKYFKDYYKVLFNDGIKLALISLISPLFSTLNIICLNLFKIDEAVIGNFQLADNIANMVSLGGASVLFIVFPDVIKQISKDKTKIQSFYTIGIKILVSSIIALIVLYYPLKEALVYFFPEYQKLSYLILFTLISRLLILLLFIPNSVWITFSKEKIYIKSAVLGVLIMGVVFVVFLNYASVDAIYNYFLIFQILFLIGLHIYFKRKINTSIL
ncbi:oligosaccharide flippase family protein [Lacinutrix mariniflava]|uniref:oligosaccharide flippase family protein n=1 Tax=Lacinutrix mariniflava TaxID=342955 RepID=UPI00128EE8F2